MCGWQPGITPSELSISICYLDQLNSIVIQLLYAVKLTLITTRDTNNAQQ